VKPSTNFLIVAPNIIVYQRLERDFASNRLFRELPLIPPEWKAAWGQKVSRRGECTEPDPSGNLFLTNVQQLYEARQQNWTPQNAIDALLGPKPSQDLSSYDRTMLDRLKDLKNLVVLNDEAHDVHDEDLAWSQSLLAIHRSLPNGLSLWLDFSATPKDQNGMYFPSTVCDYPLAQAVEDRIVKAPIIVSVMMLHEGWDVKNVSVVLGLRPFTAKAEILPEQVIGRGLRLMLGIGADRTQTLEVLGTPCAWKESERVLPKTVQARLATWRCWTC
jgi:type III restriction/modification enzyme restriction subunit